MCVYVSLFAVLAFMLFFNDQVNHDNDKNALLLLYLHKEDNNVLYVKAILLHYCSV